jgi:biopolymer transport protein ExbB
MTLLQLFAQADAVGRVVALLLLAMSVASWVAIVWKARLLLRARADLTRSVAAFWQSSSFDQARERLPVFDRESVVMPLLEAVVPAAAGTLAAGGSAADRLTRGLRNALHGILHRLQAGQVLLATIGSTAPFVGLLGTVWGIYHALTGLTGSAQITIDKLAGPVGEALIMTAAGLAVAIPAVLAYNVFGRLLGGIEAELEGFAHDLRAFLAGDVAHPVALGDA